LALFCWWVHRLLEHFLTELLDVWPHRFPFNAFVPMYCHMQAQDCIFRHVRNIAKSICQFCQICPVSSFAWINSAPTGRILMKLDIWAFFFYFQKYVKKVQVLLKSDTKTFRYLWQYLAEFRLK
jgi:hypothetical protein